jgi:hypothetical protein
MLTDKLRIAFRVYGERGMSPADGDNRAWSVSVAMILWLPTASVL